MPRDLRNYLRAIAEVNRELDARRELIICAACIAILLAINIF